MNYIEFKHIDDIYIENLGDKRLKKYPKSCLDTFETNLMGINEINNSQNFYNFIQEIDLNGKSQQMGLNIDELNFSEIISWFKLDNYSISFIKLSVGISNEHDFFVSKASDIIRRLKHYMRKFELKNFTHFLYPLYGLSTIIEGFSRLIAINGGNFLLGCDFIDLDVKTNSFKISLNKSDNLSFEAPILICSPVYAKR